MIGFLKKLGQTFNNKAMEIVKLRAESCRYSFMFIAHMLMTLFNVYYSNNHVNINLTSKRVDSVIKLVFTRSSGCHLTNYFYITYTLCFGNGSEGWFGLMLSEI